MLYESSIGCIGNLKGICIRALARALETEEPTVTLQMLEHYLPTQAERLTMIKAAVKGEERFGGTVDDPELLKRLLGMDDGQSEQHEPSSRPRVRRQRVGMRKPVRLAAGGIAQELRGA